MLIDWFTTAAQIVNFLVLVVLLKVFLYDRILGAIDSRQAEIDDRFEEAEQQKEKAREREEELQSRQQELEERRESLMAQVREEADQERERRLEQAAREVEDKRARWRDALRDQQDPFLDQIRLRLGGAVETVTRQVLEDLAGAELQEQVVERFLRALESLDEDRKNELRGAFEEGGAEPRIACATEPDEKQADRVRTAVADLLGLDTEKDVPVDRDPELVLGIECRVAHVVIGWHAADYLVEFEADLRERIRQETDAREDETGAAREETGEGEAPGGGEEDAREPGEKTDTDSTSTESGDVDTPPDGGGNDDDR